MSSDCEPRSLTPGDVSAIVVLHDSGDVIEECLRSIPDEVEVLIVDNASRDGGADTALAVRPTVRVLRRPNDGYAAGCNTGAGAASRKMLLLLNPDARLERGALQTLLRHWPRDGHGVMAPRVVDAAQRTNPTCRRRAAVWRDAVWLLPSAACWVPERWRREIAVDDPVYAHGGMVDRLFGPCLLTSRELFMRVGGLDSDFFLYGEEETYCAAVQAAGRTVTYCPDAVVMHLGGTSTGRKPAAFATMHLYRSNVLVYRKSRGDVAGRAGGVLLLAVLAVLTALAPLRRVAPLRQLRSASWCRAAAAGVVRGMR